MRNLIVSMACGGKSKKFSEVTFPVIQEYAKKCGADFHAIYNLNPNYKYIGYQKWDYVEFLKSYDRILHIDADMVVKNTTPNLFDIVPEGHFAGVDEYPFQNLNREHPPVDRYSDMKILGDVIPKFYINVGLYLFDRSTNIFTTPIENNPCYFKEQSHINYNLHAFNTPVHLLSHNFNFMSLMENVFPDKKDAHIIHYAGSWRGWSDESVLQDMKQELK